MEYSGTRQKDSRFYVQGGGERSRYTQRKKECEQILTSVSTSRDIGGGRQWVGGLKRFDGFIANRWYVR